VTAAAERVYDAFLSDDRRKTFFHGHSFTANPLACAVAIASLELFRTEGTLERVNRLESVFRARQESLQSFRHVGEVRILGGVIALELVRNKESRHAEGYLDRVGPQLTRLFLERGLLLRPLGNILYFMPPYVIREDEANWALEQIADVLEWWKWPEE
jgi:adenosylmethionine---8-amino-7-oxononanoate aminotransferase